MARVRESCGQARLRLSWHALRVCPCQPRASFLAALVTSGVGVLMITNIPYESFKQVDFKRRVPFVAMLMIVLVFVVITIDPPRILLAVFLCYALSGPVLSLLKRLRKADVRH